MNCVMNTHTCLYSHANACSHSRTYTQATVVSDVIVLYVLRKGGYYRKKKYLNVNEPITVDHKDYDIIDEEDKVTFYICL